MVRGGVELWVVCECFVMWILEEEKNKSGECIEIWNFVLSKGSFKCSWKSEEIFFKLGNLVEF